MRRFLVAMGVVGFGAVGAVGLVHCGGGAVICVDDHTCEPPDAAEPNDGSTPDGTVDSADANGQVEAGDGTTIDGQIDSGDSGPPCDLTKPPSAESCVIDDAAAVFVAPSGSDANAGTKASPVKTIAQAIQLAKAKSTHRVFVCSATYTDPLVLSGAANDFGLQVFGGFACPGGDAGAAWSYVSGTKAKIAPTSPGYALKIDTMTKAVHFEDMAFTALDAVAAGDSSIAAFVNATTDASFTRVAFTAGAGVSGAAGVTPTTPLPVATHGNDGTDNLGGAAVDCACPPKSSTGGKGGKPPAGSGDPGLPALDGGAAGSGTTPPCVGGDGANEAASPPGSGAQTLGALASTGWLPGAGSAGLSGDPGQGGGGGGAQPLGGGGSGGCGGCGGGAAAPGTGGGGSVGLLVLEAGVALKGCTIATATAGAGGAGRAGQPGAPGGARGRGGVNAGCNGGSGGRGGDGAPSGGSAGGVSIGVLYKSTSAPTIDAATTSAISLGTAGAAGIGGKPGTNDGKPGIAQAVLGL